MTPTALRRVTAAAIPVVLWLTVGATAVQAHAELDTMTPADKSSGPAPTEIVATFTEDLDPSASNLALVDSSSKVLLKGGTVDATNKKQMTLSLGSLVLAPGAYTIRWQSKSADDGDLDRNATGFTVTAASPSAAASPSVAASASVATAPSAAASSVAPSPSPSGGAGTPPSSTDSLVPILAVLVLIALLGLWLLRGRGRRAA